MKRLFTFSLILICFLQFGSSQDIHFTQYNNAPLNLNPALAGVIRGGDFRFVANFRSQWFTVTKPYSTFATSFDIKAAQGLNKYDTFALGYNFYADKAGDSEFSTYHITFPIAYHKSLNSDGTHFLALGIQPGFVTRSINYANLTFDSQFNGETLNADLDSQEDFSNLATDKFTFFDISAGMLWYYRPIDKFNFYVGYSYSHFNSPNQSFFIDVEEPLFTKHIFHGGAEYRIGFQHFILPDILVMVQGPNRELSVGGWYRYKFERLEDNENSVYLGIAYRHKDAIMLLTRVDYERIRFGFSYDLNISKLKPGSNGSGGPELSIAFVGSMDRLYKKKRKKKKTKRPHCPAF